MAPRDGSGVYHTPAGTDGVPDTTISSSAYNANVHDVETDLNTARPIVAGGTGATSADAALNSLSAEKAKQVVTDFNTMTWISGSFYAGIGQANGPVSGHAFAGLAYYNDASNLVVQARDITDAAHMVYYRIQTGGTWGSWTVDSSGLRYDAPQTLTAAQQKQARANAAVNDGNVIINGDFRVNQTAYVSAAVLATGSYGHDQWKAGASGGDYSFTQSKSSTQITIAAGKTLIQPIEDANVIGGSYTLSWTGTAQARVGINTLTPSGAYAASPVTFSGQTAATAMSVEFNAGTLGTVKLESGLLATPFVMRPLDQELIACKRYWQKIGGTANSDVNLTGYTSAGSAIYQTLNYPVEMRALPTATVVGTWGTVNCTGVGVNAAGTKSLGFYITAGAAGTVQAATTSASTYLSLDARL